VTGPPIDEARRVLDGLSRDAIPGRGDVEALARFVVEAADEQEKLREVAQQYTAAVDEWIMARLCRDDRNRASVLRESEAVNALDAARETLDAALAASGEAEG
jgi:hypothetical protein